MTSDDGQPTTARTDDNGQPTNADDTPLRASATPCETKTKTIFDPDGTARAAANVCPYLFDAPTVFVESRGTPLCDVPPITYGCKPSDGGNLILSQAERDALLDGGRRPHIATSGQGGGERISHFIKSEMALADCIRRYVGAKDFINSDEVRYCLWLKDVPPSVYRGNAEVMRRLAAVREMRLKSSAAPTRKMADAPYLFFSTPPLDGNYLALPEVSSERRDYIPIGFLSPVVIAANTMLVLPHASLSHFGVLTSSVHMAWMRAVAGRLEMRYRYSAAIVYNNFPWPGEEEVERWESGKVEKCDGGGGGASTGNISTVPHFHCSTSAALQSIAAEAQAILDARARYPGSSLADLYDPLTMPPDLRAAHAANDRAVLAAYSLAADTPESDIVAHLFQLYAEK